MIHPSRNRTARRPINLSRPKKRAGLVAIVLIAAGVGAFGPILQIAALALAIAALLTAVALIASDGAF